MATSTKLGLPLLSENQSAAEFVVNETMHKLDAVTQMQAIDYAQTQPVSAAEGDVYIISSNATGADWAGMDYRIAYMSGGGWKFIVPNEGMVAYITSGTYANKYLVYISTVAPIWQVHIGYEDMFNGHISLPLAMDYCIELKAQSAYNISSLTAETRSGTCDIAIKHTPSGGSPTTESALSVDDDGDDQDEDVDVAVDGKMELVVSNISEALDLQFQIKLIRETL